MTNPITLQSIFDHMLDLAAENPERVYSGLVDGGVACQYTESVDTPGFGCIVGEALVRAGVDRAVLAKFDRDAVVEAYDTDWGSLKEHLVDLGLIENGDETLSNAILYAQQNQDEEAPWADAMGVAVSCLELDAA